jgi:hypothetical protein
VKNLTGGLALAAASAVTALALSGPAAAVTPVSCGDLPKPDRVKCLPPVVKQTNHRHGPGHQRRGKHRNRVLDRISHRNG